ncbi:helix-hairpin-helix domain-containing protein [Actinomyces sp. MRS3W]|uniref:helix-hairpin-helix domain-containing protein n=1 Tax=Actinomyces sp. MRS3W TaxID=2800796 RepID=UPI0039670C00
MRIACSTDPITPVRRPRRLALAPRAAIGAGIALIVLAFALALRTVLVAPTPPVPTPSATAPSAAAPIPDPTASAGPEAEETGELVIHVAGAVTTPGVVTLPAGSRVVDAIDAAGGALPDADTDQLNLARVLQDGEQVRVPHQGEDASTWEEQTGVSGDGSRDTGAGAGGRININTASATELETLPGIGPALAQRIVDYREEHGPFAAVDDLTEVSGIGAAKLEALRDEVTV